MNRGNTGYRGYKMSLVQAITTDATHVLVRLACGHIHRVRPYPGITPAEWAAEMQKESDAFIVGETRLRCKQPHESEKEGLV